VGGGQSAAHQRDLAPCRAIASNKGEGVTDARATEQDADTVTRLSPLSVPETVSRLTGMLDAKGIKIFAVIDQSAEARSVGLELRDTTLVVFGNPAAGTPVMVASPLAALDLPLKILVWSDQGQTKVSHLAPRALAARHHLSPELAANLAGVEDLTAGLVAP
jgi:uncharacterized protein (DUF302 family)